MNILILGGSACGYICNNDCYRNYNIIYAGMEEHCWKTPKGEPCKTYGYRCNKLDGSYSNYLDIMGDWYTSEFWSSISSLLKDRYDADAFDIVQFPTETVKFLPGGLECDKEYCTQVAADLVAANIYSVLKKGGILYIDYTNNPTGNPTDWIARSPFSETNPGRFMYESLERVGFRPYNDSDSSTSSTSSTSSVRFSNSKIEDKVKKTLRGYPILHRSYTPQGHPEQSVAIPMANVGDYVIALEK